MRTLFEMTVSELAERERQLQPMLELLREAAPALSRAPSRWASGVEVRELRAEQRQVYSLARACCERLPLLLPGLGLLPERAGGSPEARWLRPTASRGAGSTDQLFERARETLQHEQSIDRLAAMALEMVGLRERAAHLLRNPPAAPDATHHASA